MPFSLRMGRCHFVESAYDVGRKLNSYDNALLSYCFLTLHRKSVFMELFKEVIVLVQRADL